MAWELWENGGNHIDLMREMELGNAWMIAINDIKDGIKIRIN